MTQSKYNWVANGDANKYTIFKGDNKLGSSWVASIQLNGELTTQQQETRMNIMVNALNQVGV